MEEREAAEARPEADAAAPAAAGQLVERGGQRPSVGTDAEYVSRRSSGADEGDPVRRDALLVDEAAQQPKERGPPDVVRAVEHDEERPRARPRSAARRCGGGASDPRGLS